MRPIRTRLSANKNTLFYQESEKDRYERALNPSIGWLKLWYHTRWKHMYRNAAKSFLIDNVACTTFGKMERLARLCSCPPTELSGLLLPNCRDVPNYFQWNWKFLKLRVAQNIGGNNLERREFLVMTNKCYFSTAASACAALIMFPACYQAVGWFPTHIALLRKLRKKMLTLSVITMF